MLKLLVELIMYFLFKGRGGCPSKAGEVIPPLLATYASTKIDKGASTELKLCVHNILG